MAILSVNSDPSLIRAVNATENADQRRFAGSVLADERVNFTRRDVKVDAVKGGGRAEALVNVARACGRLTHQRPPAFNNALGRRSAGNARDAHLLVGEPPPIDDDVIVERDRAVTHWHIVMPLGGALAAAL